MREADASRREDWDREISAGWGDTTFEQWVDRFVGKSRAQADAAWAVIAQALAANPKV
jgi:hypothetical protein